MTLTSDPARLQAFNDTLRSTIATSLEISEDRVLITSIRPGSVVVDIVILSSSSNQSPGNITFSREFIEAYGVTGVSVNSTTLTMALPQTQNEDDTTTTTNGLSIGAKLGSLGLGLGGLFVIIAAAVGFVIYKRKNQRVIPM